MELNRNGAGYSILPSGQKAKQAASDLAFLKEVTLQTHGLDKYGRTLADVHLLHLNRGRNIPWDLCELDC